jgi:hypothetical protein
LSNSFHQSTFLPYFPYIFTFQLPFFYIVHILSVFHLSFFRIFHIISHFNLLFFHIFPYHFTGLSKPTVYLIPLVNPDSLFYPISMVKHNPLFCPNPLVNPDPLV